VYTPVGAGVGIVPVPVEDVVFPTGGHCGT